MTDDVQVQAPRTGSRSASVPFPVYSSGSRHAVLAVLDARARGLAVSAEAAEKAFVHDPVLGRFPPDQVLRALRLMGQPQDHDDRRAVIAVLQAAGWRVSEASLRLAALDDELIGGRDPAGWWMSEEYEKQFRFEKWADGIVYVTRRERLPSAVPGRVHRLITAYRAIPPDQEPWNLVLNHGAGFERSALKVEHMRREEIAADRANADWRLARQKLVERGECGILTPLLVALRDGPPENADRELARLHRFCKRNGLPPLARKARLQGK